MDQVVLIKRRGGVKLVGALVKFSTALDSTRPKALYPHRAIAALGIAVHIFSHECTLQLTLASHR